MFSLEPESDSQVDSDEEEYVKTGTRVGVYFLDKNGEEQFATGTCQGYMSIRQIFEHPSLMDFTVPKLEELAESDPDQAAFLELAIKDDQDVEVFLLDNKGGFICGLQCEWEVLNEPIVYH